MSDTRFDLQRAADLEDELLAEFRSSASAVATRFSAYRLEIAKCYKEADQLEAELLRMESPAARHDERQVTRTSETIDGVECERIRGLDVIVPVGLIPEGEGIADIRSAKLPFPGRYVGVDGRVYPPSKISLPEDSCELLLMLADKPAPAPVPTWTPPAGLRTGRYVSKALWLVCADDEHQIYHEHLEQLIPSYAKPTEGVWHVEPGKATYIGPNQESP